MSAIGIVFERFRQELSPPEGHSTNPFALESTVDGPADRHEIEVGWRDCRSAPPTELIDMWEACRSARLFEDRNYGQWGLVLLSPTASAVRTAREQSQRARDVRMDDIVIGEFLGDQDLLVLAPSEAGTRRVLIARPLDDRTEWSGVASALCQFLDCYFDHSGEKFWESSTWSAEGVDR
jgi:hypothetical protein